MPSSMDNFAPFAYKMKAAHLPDIVVENFRHYYDQLVQGQTGLIPENDIQPITNLPDAEQFDRQFTTLGQETLGHTVLLKLNGGLGTSMGLEQAKSLLLVKNNLTFLDIIAKQARYAKTPLVLMNSFVTQADSLALLKMHDNWQQNLPFDFLQHKIPKINQATLEPIQCPDNPDLEWCPPGHGDIYAALVTSGMLDKLLQQGYRYAFVSNADNLGATIDTAILGYFVANDIPFMMEVADRTEADRKGGHLAKLSNGQLMLRESAQCPAEDMAAFQDITRHKYFNTNNLWLNLPALQTMLTQKHHVLGLPMIRNKKTADPRDPQSTPVYQLETAMGAAIAIYPQAQAIRVPRTRFAPVKTTNDFLAIRSDLYELTADFKVVAAPQRQSPSTVIELDPRYYKLITDMEARFPDKLPSLMACDRLTIEGDIKFEAGVIMRGEVHLCNQTAQQITIAAGSILEGRLEWSM